LVDWVTCSFKSATNLHQVFNLIGIDNLENLETRSGSRYEFSGYDVTHKLGKIFLLHNSSENKWLLDLSGQACREFELISCFDFVTLFGILANVNASYTRLDIAIDDFQEIYNVNMIRKAVYNKQCVTRLEDWGNAERGKIKSGRDFLTMDNFYLGSPNSRYFINFYDKKLERQNKGLDVEYDTWTRTEVRLKDEYAEMFVMHILDSSDTIGEHIFSLLNSKLVFLKESVLSKDKNKSRLSKDIKNHTRWWRKFLNTTKKLPLTVYKPSMPLIHSKSWLLHQVSVTLAMFNIYLKDDDKYDEFINELVITGLDKMESKHLKRIEDQIVLDKYVKDGDMSVEWFNTEIAPALRKQDFIRRSAKQKREHKNNVLDVYWKQVEEQQKKSALSDYE
ncbi:replication initiation factor domain-containing protein, partial [Lysinibacillus sp. FSL K6-0232]|uniref:replication initiation factor domain-containing protein n=1 Tax=Lysinibacillus sp. FSL K6-0232 TaxID=2921425 RepID=UPI0030FBD639